MQCYGGGSAALCRRLCGTMMEAVRRYGGGSKAAAMPHKGDGAKVAATPGQRLRYCCTSCVFLSRLSNKSLSTVCSTTQL